MRENNQRHNPFLLAPALALPAILFFGIASFIFSEPIKNTAAYVVSALLVFFLFGLPIALFFGLRGGKWLSARLMPVTGRGIALSFAASLLMIAQSTFLRSMPWNDFDYHTYSLYGVDFEISAESLGTFVLVLLIFALIPSLLEGVFFRGILLYEYRFGGIAFSVLFSSLIYAMTAGSAVSFPLYFLNGITLSVTATVTGNLFCSVLSHVIWILFAVFGEKYLLFLAFESETRAILFFVLAGIWIACAVFFCDASEKILRVRGEKEQAAPITLPKRNRFVVFFDMISAPMLWADFLCFSIFAILHLLL